MGMIKRILILWMMLLGLCISAQAEPYVYSSDQTPLVFFDCEDFDSEIPAQLAGVFDEWLEEHDKILCGTVCVTRYHSKPDTMFSADALMALERDEKILLLGARYTDGAWRSAVETDSFFVPGQKFDVTCLPRHGAEGGLIGALPALVCGGEEFILNVYGDAHCVRGRTDNP